MAAPAPYVVQWPAVDNSAEEVRTIFVLGFPTDVKERELQNLLRWWPGYEASQMNRKGDQPMGFALFASAAMAMAAKDALQNLVFDPETNSVLRAEMAKKNLFVKRGVVGNPTDSSPAFDPSKRMRTVGDYSPPSYSAGPTTAYIQTAPSWGQPMPHSYLTSPPPPPSYDPYAGYTVTPVTPVPPTTYAIPARVNILNTKDNPPCNTLFIGNLGEKTSEAELRALFAGQPGFRQMKVLRQGKSTVCFVEMQDIPSASNVHSALQGAVLNTSDRGGLRIQYSKNPFGRKPDGYHSSQNGGGENKSTPPKISAPPLDVNPIPEAPGTSLPIPPPATLPLDGTGDPST